MDPARSSLLAGLSARTAESLVQYRTRLRIGFPFWLRPFLVRGVLGITLGRRVYLAPAMLRRSPAEIDALIRHEMAHVRQVARLGLLRFLAIYVRDYVRLRRSGLSSQKAYATIPFEVEALQAEREA